MSINYTRAKFRFGKKRDLDWRTNSCHPLQVCIENILAFNLGRSLFYQAYQTVLPVLKCYH